MIAILKQSASDEAVSHIVSWIEKKGLKTDVSRGENETIIGLVGDTTKIDPFLLESMDVVERVQRVSEPFKRANRKFHPEDSVIDCGHGVKIGGDQFQVIAGPCSVEGENLIRIARRVKAAGATMLRGGAYKPRTSPYAYQGMGPAGLDLLCEASAELDMPIVTEIMDPRDVQVFLDKKIDVMQIGARNAQNFPLLKEVGKTQTPILLKRGMSGTIDELLMAAEYIMSEGNDNVILCERGIRTFETRTRNTFDLNAVPVLHHLSHLPVVADIIYRGAKLLQNAVYHMDRQYWAWSRWVYLGLFVLLFAVCCLTLTRRLHSRNLGTLPGRTMTFIMVGYQLSMNIFVNLFNAFSVDSAPRIFTVYSVYDEVTTILLFFLLCEILQRSDAEWDNMVLQQMMRQQRQQMELSKETVELINIKCHDIRKQLYTLGSRVPTEELDELKKAVDIYGSTVKTGNETLDVLLAERSIVCKGRGIQLDYIADGAKLDFLKPGEVYSLFGNALDNAIEAVTPLEPDRRYIGLQVRAERGMLLIRMENCAAEPLHFVDGLPQTTKGDARWHGFGVKSIRRIVQQHGGTLTMQAQDGMFRLVALLPLK